MKASTLQLLDHVAQPVYVFSTRAQDLEELLTLKRDEPLADQLPDDRRT